jgi:hypothetical protein
LKEGVKRVDVVIHGILGLFAQALKLCVDTDILEVKGLGIFVFETSPNCSSIALDGRDLLKVVWLKSFKQSFKSKIMSFLPTFEQTTTPGASGRIVAVIVRDDRLDPLPYI